LLERFDVSAGSWPQVTSDLHFATLEQPLAAAFTVRADARLAT
jgi:hypothetical protein